MAIQCSPANESVKPHGLPSSEVSRALSRIYSEELRQRLINRVLRNAIVPRKDARSTTILWGDENSNMINPPYGYLPFAMAAKQGKVPVEELKKAITFCRQKRDEYAELGDYFRMWQYSQRESLLAGVYSHLVKFAKNT